MLNIEKLTDFSKTTDEKKVDLSIDSELHLITEVLKNKAKKNQLSGYNYNDNKEDISRAIDMFVANKILTTNTFNILMSLHTYIKKLYKTPSLEDKLKDYIAENNLSDNSVYSYVNDIKQVLQN